ncbi:uncharacterized protein CEXT_441771 [Caerostris extrusa]|uniref:Uncharacterized protein n=1 Tax=Caerostris extrusa TaxID=172846 RepID=A0AAV4X985_CAEEX|nr:uncharacterized protein CEXT_441771 [Caerostris extrusa]
MRISNWKTAWAVVLLLLTNLYHIESHMLHYLHLKKFLTAVAFARALGKRPTILPIPVPIPIPIAQNEVIKIPVGGGGGKTMILDGNKGSNKGISMPHILGAGSQMSGMSFTGSSNYGYPMPGISSPNVINLSSMKGSDSNIINLSSLLGSNSNNGPPRIIILGGQNSGTDLGSMIGAGSNPSIIKMNDFGSNMQFGTNGLGINGLGLNGINLGGNIVDMDSSFSFKSPQIFQPPYNVYSDKPRRKFPLKFGGHRIYNKKSGHFSNSQPYNHHQRNNNRYISSRDQKTFKNSAEENYKKPIQLEKIYL